MLKALNDLRKAAEQGENIMVSIIETVKVYATVGEIINVLREVYGEYTENIKKE